MAAIKKLPPYKKDKKNKKKKKKKVVNLFVIRTDKNCNLKNSRPCSKCINYLYTMKYYKIKNNYYSNAKGDIVMERWSHMINCNHVYYSKRFKNKSKYKSKPSA